MRSLCTSIFNYLHIKFPLKFLDEIVKKRPFDNYQPVKETQLEELNPEQNFAGWHEDDDRGKKMAFIQGSPDRKQKNKELVQYETSFHGGSVAEAMICIKVHTYSRTPYFNLLTS